MFALRSFVLLALPLLSVAAEARVHRVHRVDHRHKHRPLHKALSKHHTSTHHTSTHHTSTQHTSTHTSTHHTSTHTHTATHSASTHSHTASHTHTHTSSSAPPSASVNASTAVGDTITSAVQAQIAAGVQAVIAAFSSNATGRIPDDVLQMVMDAINLPLSENLVGVGNETAEDALAALASRVEEQMDDVQAQVEKFLTTGNDTSLASLRACISQVISEAGLSGQRCLTANGAAVADLQSIFSSVVNQYDFALPIATITALEDSINAYLANSSLLPGAKQLVEDTESAMLSVVTATAGDYRDAVLAAEQCYIQALGEATYTDAEVFACETKSVTNGTTTVGSTLSSLERTYEDIVNQYVGFLPPNVIEDIQAIGAEMLPQGNASSPAANMSDQINSAILSVVASTSGSEVSIAYQLVDCLNILYESEPGNASAAAAEQSCAIGSGIEFSQREIVDGYLQQFYGYLPPSLVLDLMANLTVSNSTSSQSSAAVKAQLQAMFDASGAGPAYVTCYEQFEDCTMAGLSANAANNSAATCALGEACASVPFNSTWAEEVETLGGYSGIVTGLGGTAGETTTGSAGVGSPSRRWVPAAARERVERERRERRDQRVQASKMNGFGHFWLRP